MDWPSFRSEPVSLDLTGRAESAESSTDDGTAVQSGKVAVKGLSLAEEVAIGFWVRAAAAADPGDREIARVLPVATEAVCRHGLAFVYLREGNQWAVSLSGTLGSDRRWTVTPVLPSVLAAAESVEADKISIWGWWPLSAEQAIGPAGFPEGMLAARQADRAALDEESIPPEFVVSTAAPPETAERKFRSSRGEVVATKTGKDGSGAEAILRVGPATPPGEVSARKGINGLVLSRFGVPPGLLADTATGQREAWRLFVSGAVRPYLDARVAEMRAIMGRPALKPGESVKWRTLRIADLQVQARVFAQLVQGGVKVDTALRLAELD